MLTLASTYLAAYLFATLGSAHPHLARADSNVNVQSGQSIQAAIDAASAGTQITVAAGIYAEQLSISKDGISLVGQGAILVPPTDAVENICTGLAGNETAAGICIHGSDIELAEFQVEHRKVLSVGTPISDVSVTGFNINGFSGENIAVVGGSNVQVVDNALLNGAAYGVLSVGSMNSTIEHNAVISANTLSFISICIDDQAAATVRHNTVTGYYVGLCIQTSGSELAHNHVTGCCVGASLDPGIEGVTIAHNYIGPTNPGCAATTPFNIGILVYGAINGVVQYNIIEGQDANGTAAGIALTDALEFGPNLTANGNIVTENVLTNNNFDLFVNTTGAGNVFVPNQCTTPEELCSS